MEEMLITEILNCLLAAEINEEPTNFASIKLKLYCILSDYNISKKSTSLITYNKNQTPNEVLEYLAYLKVSGLSIQTLKNYDLELRLFYTFIDANIREVSSSLVLKYLYQCQVVNKSADVTIEHKRIVLNGFYHWMHLEHYIPENPCCRIKSIKCAKKILDPLTNLELEQIRLSCLSLRDSCLVEVLYSTGMRVSELISVNISQIDFGNRKTIIKGKGNKERTVRFSERSLLIVQQYLNSRSDDNDALFVTAKKPYNRLSKAGIEYLIHQIALNAGVTRIKVTPHTFRRSHGLAIYNRTKDIYLVAESLGHANISTTEYYGVKVHPFR